MFSLPAFNLLATIGASTEDIYPPVGGVSNDGRLTGVPCALVYGRRVNVLTSGGTTGQGFPIQGMNLLLPAGTDVRGPQDDTLVLDSVEVPEGSGRWYLVLFVDDIGKGWGNEHRSAGLAVWPGAWTAPYA